MRKGFTCVSSSRIRSITWGSQGRNFNQLVKSHSQSQAKRKEAMLSQWRKALGCCLGSALHSYWFRTSCVGTVFPTVSWGFIYERARLSPQGSIQFRTLCVGMALPTVSWGFLYKRARLSPQGISRFCQVDHHIGKSRVL